MLRAYCEAGAAGIAIMDVLQGNRLPPFGSAMAYLLLIDVTIQPNANPSDHGEEAIKEINADFGIPASFYRVDVRDSVAVEEAINGIVRDFGGLDVLLCSAGK